MLSFALIIFAQLLLSACSSKRIHASSKELQTNANGKIVATSELIEGVDVPQEFYEEVYPDYSRGITIVQTLPSSGELTVAQQKELRELFAQAKNSGSIHQVHVLAWGYEKDNRNRAAAIALEKMRVAITPHLEKTTAIIVSYNMEQSPSWTARLFMSKEARMKAYFKGADQGKLFSKVIIGVSTTDRKTFVHPELVSL